MDALEDLQRTVAAEYDEMPGIYQPIYDADDYDYDKEWVNAPAAYGDTYKYSVDYTIGGFHFKYRHICVHETGIITNYKFQIGKEGQLENTSNGENEETDSDDSDNDDNIVWQDFTHESSYVKEFITKYDSDGKYNYNHFCYTLFGLLNSWTLGHAIQPCLQEEQLFRPYGFSLECLPLSAEQREQFVPTPKEGETVHVYVSLNL